MITKLIPLVLVLGLIACNNPEKSEKGEKAAKESEKLHRTL